MIKKLLPAICLFSFVLSHAQQEGSAFTLTGRAGVSTTFATDYEAIGINASNLGQGMAYDGKTVSVGFAETGFNIYSDALTKKEVLNDFFSSSDFNTAQKREASREFIESGVNINLDVAPISFAYFNETAGGFAFSVSDKAQFVTKLNETAADIIFNGFNASYFDSLVLQSGEVIANSQSLNQSTLDSVQRGFSVLPQLYSELLDGTRISLSYTRSYSFSYGRSIYKSDFFDIYAGFGLKYIQGFGIMEISSDGETLNAFTSVSPYFDIDFGDAQSINPSAINSTGGGLPFIKPVGQGFGYDFGASMVYLNRFKFGFAINNIGSITWDGNVYQVQDTLLDDLNTDGVDSYNLVSELQKLGGEDGIFDWQGKRQITVKLPTVFRFGASYEILEEKLHAGFDVVIPLNDEPGNFVRNIYAIGGDFRPVPWLEVSTGFNIGGNTESRANIPIGVTFIVGQNGAWEAGVASRDAITYFRNQSPNLSASFGFLRFRF